MGERRRAKSSLPAEPRAGGTEPSNALASPSLARTGAAVRVPALDDMAMIYLRVDRAGDVRWASEPALQLPRQAGLPHGALTNLTNLLHDHERCGIQAALADTVDDGRAEVVVRLAGPGGGATQRFLHLVLSRDDGPDEEIVVQGWDVSALVLRLRQLEDDAVRDSVTGLANRTTFLDLLHHEIARSARSGTEIAVLVADVDALTTVSDTYGRDVADTVLAEIGQRLAASLRPGDTLARIGGDEFAVICPDLTSPHQAMTVADRLRATATEPLTVGDRQQIMTLSVGVAFAPGEPDDHAASLLRRADRALTGRGSRHSTLGVASS